MRQLLVLAALSVCLFAANFMSYAALYAALGIDYLVWRRRERPLGWREARAAASAPQVLLNGADCLGLESVSHRVRRLRARQHAGRPAHALSLVLARHGPVRILRAAVLVLALGIGMVQRPAWLVRGCVALLIYVAVIALVSPQPVSASMEAEVRYLARCFR